MSKPLTRAELRDRVDEIQGRLYDLVSELSDHYPWRHRQATDELQDALHTLDKVADRLLEKEKKRKA